MKRLYGGRFGAAASLLVAAGLFSLAVGIMGCDPPEDPEVNGPGTGDSTLKGNVASLGTQAASARAGVAGVTVSIEGTDLQAVTDANGRFTLTGVPAGQIELRFVSGAIEGILVLDMPPGTTLELRDVRVTSESVVVGQVYEVEMETVTVEEDVSPGEDGWSDDDSESEDGESGDEGSEDDDSS